MPGRGLEFLLFAVLVSLGSRRLLVIAGDCPLDFSWSNFTLAANACSNQNERAKCCRYINAIVAVSVARYANATGTLGVPSASTDICLSSVSITLQLNGIPPNATMFCGLGQKIRVSYQCEGRGSILEMLQSPNFSDVIRNCKMPLSSESSCRRCLNSDIIYLRHLIGAEDNVTLNTCRDAAFVALANQGDNFTALEMANCFFSVQRLLIFPVNASEPSTLPLAPTASPTPMPALAPYQHVVALPLKQHHHMYRFTLIVGIGIMVSGVAILLVIILILLIFKKSRELKNAATPTENSWNAGPPLQVQRYGEVPSTMFRRFSYKETKRATNYFNNIIGRGESETLYKAQFDDGFKAAVKRMNRVLEQGEEQFSRDTELLGRLHHRHLVALRGYCIEKHERFLIYEYMANGSLKDHLHSTEGTPLTWQTRIQIAIDVANALEYLHFYCDPPLCHGDIKCSNILLDGNFVAKVADFGLAHTSRSGAISSEPGKTDIWVTPGYMDPEYAATNVLTEKSDVYSFGVLLLELVTGRQAVHDDKNLVEGSKKLLATDSKLPELVDPVISDSFDLEQLQVVSGIILWCTQIEGSARPSIKQVLRMLYERLDPMHSGFARAIEDEEGNYGWGRTSRGKTQRNEIIPYSGDARCLQSSSSTSRSYCSRSILLQNNSPQSPSDILSV